MAGLRCSVKLRGLTGTDGCWDSAHLGFHEALSILYPL